ncbi:nucleoside deaminase [Methylocystis sp. IM3]|uniref:nucleoside deaminase n=1 Tax=Methylocystis sp. IM3 TaxID=3136722 RepID=UPI00268A7DE1
MIDRLFSSATTGPGPSPADLAHMAEAVRLMRQTGVIDKTGGPFGAVIVRRAEVLAACGNSVLGDNDPTAHAEINAIRMACKKVGSPHLDGAAMFTSCECCPMCYAAARWAHIGKIYFAASWADYADLFDDSSIGRDMLKPLTQRSIRVAQLMRAEAVEVWREYRALSERDPY